MEKSSLRDGMDNKFYLVHWTNKVLGPIT